MNNTSDYSNRREDLFIYLFIFSSVAGKFFFLILFYF